MPQDSTTDGGGFVGEILPRDCPLCQTPRARARPTPYSRGDWHVVQCEKCGFVYQNAAPKEELLSEELAWEHSHAAETARRKKARPRIKAASAKLRHIGRRMFGRREAHAVLEKYGAPGAVIDLGCADGGQIAKIGKDWIPYGVEISKTLAGQARERFAPRGGDVIHAPVMDGLKTFSDGFFSGAVLRSYLEHESRPHGVLEELYRVLRPDAAAVVKVPNFSSWNRKIMGRDWCGFRWPEHLNYFTPKSLPLMAEGSGFRLQKMWAFPFSDNLWALLRRKKGVG